MCILHSLNYWNILCFHKTPTSLSAHLLNSHSVFCFDSSISGPTFISHFWKSPPEFSAVLISVICSIFQKVISLFHCICAERSDAVLHFTGEKLSKEAVCAVANAEHRVYSSVLYLCLCISLEYDFLSERSLFIPLNQEIL